MLADFLLLADVYPDSLSHTFVWILGGGFAGTIATILVRGLWSKYGERETRNVVAAWHHAPDQVKARKQEARDVVENEIRRDDGLIAMELKVRLAELRKDQEEDQKFRMEVRMDLEKIKTALNVMTHGAIAAPKSDGHQG